MARKKRPVKPLDTIWEVSDELWARIEPILEADWQPSPKGGQPPADWRLMFNGIIHRLRSSCQWNHLPEEFGSDRTIHRWFQRWCRNGVMEKIWAALVQECVELDGVLWEWQSADASMGKARFGGEKGGPKPYGSREIRHEEESGGGPRGRAAGGRDRRRERQRLQVVGGHD
jgi:putative transposase